MLKGVKCTTNFLNSLFFKELNIKLFKIIFIFLNIIWRPKMRL